MTIRTMSQADLEVALGWARAEGWNPGLEDAATFFQADPEGFLMGWVDECPVGSISAVDWGSGFGFIGLYIMLPEFRGQGLGMQLWRAGMERLQGKVVGLDGVVAQQANYARSGFRLAHRSLRYQGKAGALAGPRYGAPASDTPFETLLALDTQVSPATRPAYLQAWLNQSRALAWTGQDSLIMARPCHTGYKIGPLIAPDGEEARRLLGSVCRELEPEAPVFLDTPEPNRAALQMVADLGMTAQFETARMYRKGGETPLMLPPEVGDQITYTGDVPPLAMERWFGVTTFELG